MKLSDLDTEKLMFDIAEVDGDIFETFPELKKYPEFKWNKNEGPDCTKTIKTIILLYDMNSELRKKVEDFGQRKRVAAKLCGFELKANGKFDINVENFLKCENQKTNFAIIKYCKMQSSMTWRSVVALEIEHDRFIVEMIDGRSKTKLKDNIATMKELHNGIKEMIKELFSGDINKLVDRDLYQVIENEKINLNPESLMKRRESNDWPISKYAKKNIIARATGNLDD